MAVLLFANRAKTTLAAPLTTVSTSMSVAAGSGALFPDPGPDQYFKVTLVAAANEALREIIHVTSRIGDTFTIVRGQESTTPLTWVAGDLAQNLVTAGSLAAMVQSIQYQPVRVVTVSGVFVMTTADYAIGMNRISSPAASSTTLPSGTAVGQEYEIADLAANFNAYPVTINAPVGHNIANLSSVVLNVNRQVTRFRLYNATTWSVQ